MSTDTPERFREVEPLRLGGRTLAEIRSCYDMRDTLDVRPRYHSIAEARALRDWLTKALPESQEKVMPATKAQDHGITVNVGDDGAWVCFTTKSGKSFVFQPAQEWGNPNSLGHQAIREWCLEMQAKREATALPEEKP